MTTDAAALVARFAETIDARSHQPVPFGRLAGLELNATVRRDLTDGELTLQVCTYTGCPARPPSSHSATPEPTAAQSCASSSTASATSPTPRDRLAGREHAARKPAAAARQALAQPFKYADELHAATHRCATIAEQMTARQRDVNNDTWPPVATQAHPRHGVDADSAEIRRLISATVPSPTSLSSRGAARPTTRLLSAVDFRHGGAAVWRHGGVGYERRSNSGERLATKGDRVGERVVVRRALRPGFASSL